MGRHTEWVVVTGARFAGDPEQISEVLVHRDSASVHTRPDAHISAKGLGDTFTAALVTALLDGRAVEQAVSDASAEVRSRAAALQPSPAVP
ncbi:bifunctional hydroxymethylpyrimidine kinase/phosphomethylpyrimidine kinase [Leucobacter sp. BZR 635]